MAEKALKSGRVLLPTGESIIPSSTRADGSVRKAIKVKPGYKPPEDVEVYKNSSAESWKKHRGKGRGVPGAAPAVVEENLAKSAANAKRREREKAKKAVEADQAFAQKTVSAPLDPDVERAKEARKLAKKLRQARELKDKKETGGALLPEQFEKVIKIQELMRQLEKLGFNHEGEKEGEGEKKVEGEAEKKVEGEAEKEDDAAVG